MNYSLSRSSRRELAEAAQWYEDRRDGLGDEFLDEVYRCAGLAARRPGTFPIDEDAPPGYVVRNVLLQRFPFRLIYSVRGGMLVVLAVAHAARQPGYWLDRLEEE